MLIELAITIIATATFTALGTGLLFTRSHGDGERLAYLVGVEDGYAEGHADGMERALSLCRLEPLDGTALDQAIGIVKQTGF